MARGNAALSRWVVDQAVAHQGSAAERIAELGPGPGVGLEALLTHFPDAHVWGIDISSVMVAQSRSRAVAQSRRRNRAAVDAGRLTLLHGGVASASACAPADIVMANHVLYFWDDPVAELTRLRSVLRPGGVLALGYQLRQNMPAMAQKRFPAAGHRLYDTEADVTDVAAAAGLRDVVQEVKGPAEVPEGRVMLATA